MSLTDTAPADPLAGLSPAVRDQITAAEENLANLQREVTQREWLLITQALNHPRKQVIEDGGLRLLALAWVKEKRDKGGASWEVLLDMTDDQLLEFHGFPTEDDDAPDDAGEVLEPAGAGDVIDLHSGDQLED